MYGSGRCSPPRKCVAGVHATVWEGNQSLNLTTNSFSIHLRWWEASGFFKPIDESQNPKGKWLVSYMDESSSTL